MEGHPERVRDTRRCDVRGGFSLINGETSNRVIRELRYETFTQWRAAPRAGGGAPRGDRAPLPAFFVLRVRRTD